MFTLFKNITEIIWTTKTCSRDVISQRHSMRNDSREGGASSGCLKKPILGYKHTFWAINKVPDRLVENVGMKCVGGGINDTYLVEEKES